MLRIVTISAAALVAGLAVPASAATTYQLVNGETPTNARDGGVAAYVDLHAPIVFKFTVAAALASNATLFWDGSNVLSWQATGGKSTSTISSDITMYPDENLSRLWLTTDSSGNISTWNIVAKATDPAIAGSSGTSPEFRWFNVGGTAFTTINFLDNHTGLNTGSVLCTSGCTQSFAQSDAVGAVPEAATWAMMLMGFGMVGFSLRRRAGKVTTRIAFA